MLKLVASARLEEAREEEEEEEVEALSGIPGATKERTLHTAWFRCARARADPRRKQFARQESPEERTGRTKHGAGRDTSSGTVSEDGKIRCEGRGEAPVTSRATALHRLRPALRNSR